MTLRAPNLGEETLSATAITTLLRNRGRLEISERPLFHERPLNSLRRCWRGRFVECSEDLTEHPAFSRTQCGFGIRLDVIQRRGQHLRALKFSSRAAEPREIAATVI